MEGEDPNSIILLLYIFFIQQNIINSIVCTIHTKLVTYEIQTASYKGETP